MIRVLWVFTIVLGLAPSVFSQILPTDSSTKAQTIFVFPAGPVAGEFTSAARLTVVDTIAGWAKIQLEGWVPVVSVLDRPHTAPPGTSSSWTNPSSSSSSPRQQCAAITKKGKRCTRKAAPGSRYCWQHQGSQ
jgi:hypothetical protein